MKRSHTVAGTDDRLVNKTSMDLPEPKLPPIRPLSFRGSELSAASAWQPPQSLSQPRSRGQTDWSAPTYYQHARVAPAADGYQFHGKDGGMSEFGARDFGYQR